jgi:hypothetical protein
MTSKEQQLCELLETTSITLTHLTAAMTSFTFDLVRSGDPVVRRASVQMLDRLETVRKELDQHWLKVSGLTGGSKPCLASPVEEVHLHAAC